MMNTKFKPSWEIYNRIIWDTQLNEKVFSIGYVDRVSASGIREKPLVEWDDSDIPWGRVQYFACQKTIVWDRKSKIDLFTAGALPAIAFKPSHMANRSANFFPKPIFCYSDETWQPVTATISSERVSQLKIATFNILSNPRSEDAVRLTERAPFIIEALQRCDADILVLQEVCSSFFGLLLSQAWVKRCYLSERPSKSSTSWRGHKTVILSKLPFTLLEYLFSPAKKFPIATWSLNDQNFHVIGVHLSSNYASDASQLRQQQLTDCINFVSTLGGAYAGVGDFNMRGEEGADFFSNRKLNDVWLSLRPDETGYTFEPDRNPLAAQATLTGLPARFDRICLSESSHWQPLAIDLFADQPIQPLNLFLSDHYGLLTTLRWQPQPTFTTELQTIQPTYKSAVVLIPPKSVWPPIQSLRKQYDSRVERWMPHITLLYGFLPDVYFEQAADVISMALKSISPFSATFTEYAFFTHRASLTAWLKTDAEATEQIQALQARLFSLFPQCSEQSHKNKTAGFTPHLTIGQFKSSAYSDLGRKMEEKLPTWQPITFPVETIALISRTDHQPFTIKSEIALKNGSITNMAPSALRALRKLLHQVAPPPNAEKKATQAFVIDLVQEVCDEVLGNRVPLHPYGSALLGTNSAQSDVDLLCITPFAPEEFLHAVYERIEASCEVARTVLDARIPILKMTIEGISIDLQCAYHTTFPISIATISETDRYQFDTSSWLAISGYLEAHKIQELLKPYLRLSLFQELTRLIKAWAKRRLIYGQSWGFLGGYSWTILAAWACLRYSPTHPKAELIDLLSYFFKEFATYDWSEPISITIIDQASSYKRHPYKDKMPILTTIKPYYNSATTVTASTLQTMQSEIKRAAQISDAIQQEQSDWATLLAPANPAKIAKIEAQTSHQLTLQINGPTEAAIQHACGWISVNMVQWLITFEQELQAFVRPSSQFIHTETSATTTIALQLKEKEALVSATEFQIRTLACGIIAQQWRDWPERPPDCSLTIRV